MLAESSSMEQFQIILPSTLLRPYVKQYWFLAIDNAERSSQRYVPSGHAMLAFHRGDRIYSTLHKEVQPRSSLCGQSTFYTDIIYSGTIDLIMVVFQSVAARAIFGIPMDELRNKNMNVDLLGDTALLDLEKRLMEAGGNNQCVNLIEQYLLRKLNDFTSDRFDRMDAAVRAINKEEQDLAELSRSACLGYKQFKRVFVEYTGLNPKKFLQISRFRKVLHSLHTGSQTNLSQLACDRGYCDKSHLIKDFKTFIGYTPKEYLSICDPYSESLFLFDSIFINGERETQNNKLRLNNVQ